MPTDDARAFWLSRWAENKIAFHEGRPNDLLTAHLDAFAPPPPHAPRRILVPLCGKTEDLAFLAAQGHAVVGVELADAAARAFFVEHDLRPTTRTSGTFTVYTAAQVTIFVGDFFATTPALLGPVDAFYDRAALIALPPEARGPYVEHLRGLLPAGSRGLVVTLDYPQALMDGPPFAVTAHEVRGLYAGAEVQQLAHRPASVARLHAVAPDAVATERCVAIRV